MIYTVPTTETKLYTLTGRDNPYMQHIILQAAKTNTVDILFGPVGDASHFLEPGKSVYLPLRSLNDYVIKTTAASQSVILSTL